MSLYFPCGTKENHVNLTKANQGLNLKILEREVGMLPLETRLLTDAN